MHLRLYISLALVCLLNIGQSQTSKELLDQFDERFEGYVQHQITQDSLNNFAYSTLWEDWVKKATTESHARHLLHKMAGYHFRQDTNLLLFKHDHRSKKYWKEDSILLYKLDSNQMRLLASNFYIAELISKEHLNFKDLENRYAHKLKKTLKAYELEANQTVVEIGAGFGFTMTIMLLCTDQIELYINELNEKSLAISKRRFQETQAFYPAANVHFVQGDEKSINIEKQVDKIIAKNTFHHFEYREEMLADIAKTLKPDGYFYLDEIISNSKKKRHKKGCKKALTLNEIRKIMKKEGFKLHKETNFPNRVILKYSIQKS